MQLLSTLDNGSQSFRYDGAVIAAGGVAPYTFAVTAGALPAGLALDANTGKVTGAPTTGGDYTFTITATDSLGATASLATTIRVAPRAGAIYCCLVDLFTADFTIAPANQARVNVQRAAGLDAIRRQDWRVYRAVKKESLRAEACTLELEIKNPGASGLIGATGRFVLLWQEDTANAGRALALGKIQAIPNDLASVGGTVTLTAECRWDTWEADVYSTLQYISSAAENTAVPAAGTVPPNLAPDGLFYDSARGPAISDYLDASVYTVVIDPRTLQSNVVPIVAFEDVSAARPAGNFASSWMGTVYDVSAIASDFQVRRSEVNTLHQISTKLSVAYDQRWSGFVDLTGHLKLTALSESPPVIISGAVGPGKATWGPQTLVASLPQPGAALGTGWTVTNMRYKLMSAWQAYDRNVNETAVQSAIAQGYTATLVPGKANIPWGFIELDLSGLVVLGRYSQRRQEQITVTSSIDLQPMAICAAAPQLGANVNIADPTVDTAGTPWLPNQPYNIGDIAWYGGVRYYCTAAHTSSEAFDATKWLAMASIDVDRSGQAIADWAANTAYAKGQAVRLPADSKVYIALIAHNSGASWDSTKWYLAPTSQALPWMANTLYQSGAVARVGDATYYRKTEGVSAGTWGLDQTNWVAGAVGILPMSPTSPVYFSTPRGQISVKHLGMRHFSRLMKAARCLEAAFVLPAGAIIDAGVTTSDMTAGLTLRVRSSSVPGAVQEVIGVVTDLTTTWNGATGVADVAVVLGLCPGGGMTAGVAGTTFAGPVFPPAYSFGSPQIPVDTALLGVPGYVVFSASVSGAGWAAIEAQMSAMVAAATSDDDIRQQYQSIVQASPNALTINMRPLVQMDLVPLTHPTMETRPFFCPKNIDLG